MENELNNFLDKLLKQIPLETRVRVKIEGYFISEYGGTFLMPLDENGNELPEVVEANRKCLEKAQPLLNSVLEAIKEWKQDGCP